MKASEINESLIGKRILISESILKHGEPRTDDLVEVKVKGFDSIMDMRCVIVGHNPVTFVSDGEKQTRCETTLLLDFFSEFMQLSEREIHYNNEKHTKYVIDGWEYLIKAAEKYFNVKPENCKTWFTDCLDAQFWNVIVSPKKRWFIDIVNKLYYNVDAEGHYYNNRDLNDIEYTVRNKGRAKKYEYVAITTDREWARRYIITIKPYLNNNTYINIQRAIYEDIQ